MRLSLHALSSRSRLLVALAVILLLSFVGVSFINYSITRDSVRQEIILNDLPLTRDNIYSELSNQLMRPMMVASSMASDTFVKDWALEGEKDIGKITRYLSQIHLDYEYFSTFFVSSRTRNYYHFAGLHKVVSPDDPHDVWFYSFIDTGQPYVVEVDTDEASENTLTIFINFRVEAADDSLLGVTGVGLKLDSVASMIREYQDKYHRSIYLVDSDGFIQVHQDMDLVRHTSIRDLPELAPHADTLLGARAEPVNVAFERNGHDILLAVRYIPDIQWFIFVEQDADASLATARMNFLRSVLSGVTASIFIITLTLLTINRYQRRVEALTYSDELTGAANRRGLDLAFEKGEYALVRYQRPMSLILIDLDNFKQVNDSLGHLAGDKVLKEISRVIATAIRPTDTLGRWGGDEFVIITETDGRESEAMADRIRNLVRNLDMAGEKAPDNDPRRMVTICCGVAEFQEGDDLDTVIRRADTALYACKTDGGNKVLLNAT